MYIHVVRPGESIYSIGRTYGVSIRKIVKDNEIENPNNLRVGQSLVIIEGQRKHIATYGQSICDIAMNYGTTAEKLMNANPNIKDPSNIQLGEIITIPEKTKKYGTINVNGYALPNADMYNLKKSLPYLTYLSIFSYKVLPDGKLKEINDIPLINTAREFKVAPIMVISNIEDKSFTSEVITKVLTNKTKQQELIDNIVSVITKKNYYGVNVDFQHVNPENQNDYSEFLRRLANILKPLGYVLITSLPPKTSQNKDRTLGQVNDYNVHNRLVDLAILTVSKDNNVCEGFTRAENTSEIKQVLDYAVAGIDSKKICISIPNDSYDWSDKLSDSKNCDCKKEEERVELYDAINIQSKLKIIDKYKLGGISYWISMKNIKQNLLVQKNLYDTKKVI